jgi:acyl-CoA thioester hydrolase
MPVVIQFHRITSFPFPGSYERIGIYNLLISATIFRRTFVTNTQAAPIYSYELTVPESALDENGHVNNVNYVQWMQDAAVSHYGFLGGIELTQALGATWVVRSHTIEYLRPAFAGEQIKVETWVVNIRRVRSLRRYRFSRVTDGKLLVKGETDWVFVDARTGAPRAVPEEIVKIFPLLPDSEETRA